MDNVKPVTKWTDGANVLYDSEEAAIQGEARRVIRLIICEAIEGTVRSLDIDMIVGRRTALIDALRKIEGK